MKIEYLRTAEHSYMIVKESDYPFEQYEVQMIVNNDIPSLLPLKIIVGDGKTQYWYDLTGMQPLERLFSLEPVDAEQLRFLLQGICDLKKQMEDYLLDDRNIVFTPRMVCFDRIHQRIRFCYVPGYSQAEDAGLRGLFEEILQHLDHTDSAAVKLGYEMYERCARVDFVVEDVSRCLRECRESEDDVGVSGTFEEEMASQELDFLQEPEPSPPRSDKKRVFHRKKKPAGRRLRGRKKNPDYREALEREQVLDYVAEREKDYNPTVCFSEERMRQVWELSYQGSGHENSFLLEKFPFLLGKDGARADGVLFSDAVSRVHACITQGEEGLCLEDYNSTNGTYVNGKLLPMNTPCPLQGGDRIMLATEEYVLVDRRIPK